MNTTTMQSLARWLRAVVLLGLSERTEKQAAGLWSYEEDTPALTAAHSTLKAVSRLLWKKARPS